MESIEKQNKIYIIYIMRIIFIAKKNIMNKKAFSLVELIVVIAIIAILWTIATFTLSKWLGRNRDAARSADINNIMSALETYKYEHQSYPFPDDYTLITYSGNTIGYQWYIGSTVINKLNLKNDPKDPYDNKYYTYSTNENKTKYQLWVLLEKADNISYNNTIQAEDNDYNERFISVKWDKVGMIFDNSNTPLQEIYTGGNVELQSLTGDYKLYFSNKEYIIWDGEDIFSNLDIYRSDLDIYNPNLVFHLNFDKWYGYTAYDSSINQFNASLNDGAEWIEGIYGNAIYYDGVDNNVTISDSGSSKLDPANNISVSLWVNPMATPSHDAILIDKANYGIKFLTSNKVEVYVVDETHSITYLINTNKWTHIAFTYDENVLLLYVNGEVVDSLTLGNTIPANNNDITIWDWNFKGIIDEVSVYDDILSKYEIKSLYNVYK